MDKNINQKPEVKSGLAIAALVIGIIGICLSAIPIINNFAAILGILALILSIIGLIKKNKKGLTIAALIISIITIVIVIASQAMYSSAINSVSDSVNKTTKENNTPVSVIYDVTGTSINASITYSTYSNGNSGTEQTSGQTLPFSKTVTGTKGWSGYYLTAMNSSDDSGTVSCKITVAGKVVSQQSSNGAYASVSCGSSSGDSSSK